MRIFAGSLWSMRHRRSKQYFIFRFYISADLMGSVWEIWYNQCQTLIYHKKHCQNMATGVHSCACYFGNAFYCYVLGVLLLILLIKSICQLCRLMIWTFFSCCICSVPSQIRFANPWKSAAPMGFAHTWIMFLRPHQQVIRPVLNSYTYYL